MAQIDQTTAAVARAIREIRSERDMTLTQVSDRTGIMTTHICRHEKGGRGLRVATLVRYADAFGTLPSEILRRAGL